LGIWLRPPNSCPPGSSPSMFNGLLSSRFEFHNFT
jgi:hypothetical protein